LSGLSTHVLDTMHGKPAEGVAIRLLDAAGAELTRTVTNADGRCDAPLLAAEALAVGGYRLEFAVGDYFRSMGVALPGTPFLDKVVVDFGVAEAGAKHHVPLLVSPYGYSTYRGS